MSIEVYTHDNGLQAIDVGGCPRMLASIPTTNEKRMLLKSFLEVDELVPRSKWQPVSRRNDLTFMLNQRSHGSCVGFGTAGSLMRARGVAGMTFVKLSGSFVYAQINGNRDNGAMIGDAMPVILKGTCPDEMCDWDSIWWSRISSEAKAIAPRYRALECVRLDTVDEIGSAIQRDWIVVPAVMVGNNFMNLDGEGIAGFSNGPGNHCVSIDGMVPRGNGQWKFDMPNSWGLDFGENGRCYLSERHLSAVQQDCYAIKAAAMDPNDPNMPPVMN